MNVFLVEKKILTKTREIVIHEFDRSENEVKDGMDIALCSLEFHENGTSTLKYAGAHNPLWIVRKGSDFIEEYKADKQPIGNHHISKDFTTHTIELNTGDSLYIFSDGIADQFGGEKGKKFKTKNLKTLILSFQNEPMESQHNKVLQVFEDWRRNVEQLDDICIIGVKV